MSPRAKQFIELQAKINDQIDTVGKADIQLAGELEILGDMLTNDEINQVCEWANNQ